LLGSRVRDGLATAIVIGVLAVLPSSASAGSATLTSPSNGATFYTGSSNSILTGVPYSANRDISGCVNTLFRVYRDGLPILQGVTNDLTGNVATGVGDHQVYAAFLCTAPNNWIYSSTVTIHVVAGIAPPPPGGGRDPLDVLKEAYCKSQKEHILEIGALAKEVGDGEGVEKLEQLSATLFVISQVLEPASEKLLASPSPVARFYGAEARFIAAEYDELDNLSEIAIADSKATARGMLRDRYSPLAGRYTGDCGAALPEVKIKPVSIDTQLLTIFKYLKGKGHGVARASAAAARPRRPSALDRRLAAAVKAFRTAVHGYGKALRAVGQHAPSPSFAEEAALRSAGARLAAAVNGEARVRADLPRAVLKLKAHRKSFPRKLRSNPVVKAIDGWSIAKIMDVGKLATIERELVAYLRTHPTLRK
jgi:hypothetical protein